MAFGWQSHGGSHSVETRIDLEDVSAAPETTGGPDPGTPPGFIDESRGGMDWRRNRGSLPTDRKWI